MKRLFGTLRGIYALLFVTLAVPAMALAQGQAGGSASGGGSGGMNNTPSGVGGSGANGGFLTNSGWGWWIIVLAIIIGLIIVAWFVSLTRNRQGSPPSTP